MSNLRSLIRRAALEVPEIRRLRERLLLAEAGAAEAAAARAAEAAAARAVETASAQIAALESRRTELEAECGTVTQQLLAAERERDLLAARLAGAEPVPALMARLDERIDALAHDTRAATDTVLQSTRAATDTVLQSTQAATDTVLQSTQATTDTVLQSTQAGPIRLRAARRSRPTGLSLGSPRPSCVWRRPTERSTQAVLWRFISICLRLRSPVRWTKTVRFHRGPRATIGRFGHLAATGLRPRPP
jgi:hypothetical protein